tara:strand:+ start:3252 stop:4211 length:960 start_codon:yes stop_codon:yes gene_type:complete
MKKNVSCPNCNQNNFSIFDKYYHGRRLGIKYILICNNCKLKQSDNLPNNEKLKSFYNNINTRLLFNYSKQTTSETYYTKFDSYLKFIIDKTNINIKDNLNVIDIGAGNGRTLLQIKDLTNWSALGIEPDKTKCEVLSFFKLNIINDVFQNISSNLKNDHYDLITISQVLEHVENPVDLLKEINKKLNKNGYLWIDVPLCNVDYFNSRVNDDVGHLYFFDQKILGQILEQSNYQPLFSGSYGKIIGSKRKIFSSLKLFLKYYLHRFLPISLLNINKFISKITNKYKNIENFEEIFNQDNPKINHNIFDRDKLFYLVKKND